MLNYPKKGRFLLLDLIFAGKMVFITMVILPIYPCSAADMIIEAGGKAMVPTDLSIAVPSGTYGRVAPRSGLAVKNFIDVGAGVIDEDYRGPVNVVLFNFGKSEFIIKQGDRIAQLVLEKIAMAEVFECENLDETERGESGFGSTGVSNAL